MNSPYQPPSVTLDSPAPDAPWRRLRKLASHRAVMSLGDQVFVSGASFATSILIGRSNAEALGVFALAMTVVNFTRGVQGEVVAAPFTVYSQSRQGRRLKCYSASALVHQLATTLAAMLAVVAAMFVLPAVDAPDAVRNVLPALLAATPVVLLASFIRHYQFARMRFRAAAVTDGVLAALQIGGLAWIAYRGQMTVENALLVMGVASASTCAGWFLFRRREFELRLRAVPLHWRRNWRFARWTLSAQLLGCSTPFLLPWAISITQGEQQTGVYAACATTVGLSMMFVLAIANVLTPTAARAHVRHGRRGLIRVLIKAAVLFVTVVGTFIVGLAATGDALVVWFYGPQYAGTEWICLLLAGAVLMNSLSIVVGNGLWALDKPHWSLPADMALLVGTVVAAVALIPAQGIVGAAWATLIGAAAGAAVRALILRQLLAREKLQA